MNILNNHTSKKEKEEILNILNMILEQNYLQNNNQFYKQNEGLAMGAPTSSTLAEIFIQHLEHTIIYKILQKHQIVDYYRYIDDILIICNEHHTNIDNTSDEFNKIHPKIKFTIEKENQDEINYLDISHQRRQ
jgi:nucleoside-specific outer membrane channel protein Tsx